MIEIIPLRDDVMKPGRRTEEALRHLCDILDEHVKLLNKIAELMGLQGDLVLDLRNRVADLERKMNN